MGMEIIKNLVSPDRYNIKCPYSLEAEFIVVHNTANDASAENEVAYMIRNNYRISFHYAVDFRGVVQGIPENRNTWNAGDGANGPGNRKGLSIEICYSKSGGSNFINSEIKASKFIALKLKENGWGIDKVKKHQDFNNKYCPHRTLDLGWQRFLNMVHKELIALNSPGEEKKQIDIYRVQVGAYQEKANADNMLEELKKAGFNGFIRKDILEVNPIVKRPLSEYREVHNLKVIETDSSNVYVGALEGDTLRKRGVFGISGVVQNNPEAHLTRSIWSIMANAWGPIGENSHQNHPDRSVRRGTLVIYMDYSVEILTINNISEIEKPFRMAIGGGSLIPNYNPTGERILADMLRNTYHTAIGYKGDRIYLIISTGHCHMSVFRDNIEKLNLDGAIFLDGGDTTQMFYPENLGRHSTRPLASGVFLFKV